MTQDSDPDDWHFLPFFRNEAGAEDDSWIVRTDELEYLIENTCSSGLRPARWQGSAVVATQRVMICERCNDAIAAAPADVNVEAKMRRKFGSFVAECRVNLRLRHPNVVRFLGVSVNPATRSPKDLIFELPSGGSVLHMLERAEPLIASRIHAIAVDIASALKYLHSRKPPVLHLSVNPRTILIDALEIAKLMPLATVPSSLPEPTDFDLMFVAPELRRLLDHYTDDAILDSKRVCPITGAVKPDAPGKTPAADLYSLGKILLELLAIKQPLGGNAAASDPLCNVQLACKLTDLATALTALEPTERPCATKTLEALLAMYPRAIPGAPAL